MKLGLELALEPVLARVQALALQAQALVQALAQVAKLERLEPQAQARLEPQVQVQLELEQHLQQRCPKLQLHRRRCKVPDRSREPQ